MNRRSFFAAVLALFVPARQWWIDSKRGIIYTGPRKVYWTDEKLEAVVHKKHAVVVRLEGQPITDFDRQFAAELGKMRKFVEAEHERRIKKFLAS